MAGRRFVALAANKKTRQRTLVDGFTKGLTEFQPKRWSFTVSEGQTYDMHEALLTRLDIKKWSPMVAYSGCDAIHRL